MYPTPYPEIDEDRLPNPLLKPGLSMSPRQRKKVSRTTPTMKAATQFCGTMERFVMLGTVEHKPDNDMKQAFIQSLVIWQLSAHFAFILLVVSLCQHQQ
uniref:Uncharacterized protein n=1 Tax=Sphaerodactylus townsendi TaxID=933632 RepID=A0ACB8EN58_9SAUR